MKTLLTFLLLAVAVSVAYTQQDLVSPDLLHRRILTQSTLDQPQPKNLKVYKIPGKKASQYTPEDWGAIIDSTWGQGQTGSEQLQIFDTFWNAVDQRWAGFPNFPVNAWDSLRNVYRPQIGSGLSRGRFYALMSRMWLGLSELHTLIIDYKVDTAFGGSSFRYRPGVPLLCIGPWLRNVFGAAVTPLPDSTNLVYRAATGNPLGLAPGDLVLGYERVPWKRLYRQLLDAGVPVSIWNSWTGSSPGSKSHFFLMAVGLNWGMFDTIDIVKFSSGDTLHIPTARLDTTIQTVWPSDQVPVLGVPMPQAPLSSVAVSWGAVQGTNIGYIYVWDWNSSQTASLFQSAINDLVNTRNVTGLVLDFRMNWGGSSSNANGGLRQLFNFDPTAYLSGARRNSPNDRLSFTLTPATWGFTPSTLFDRPIAVLIGPGCFSAGDHNALRMRFHPMTRFFGKPTNGAFVSGTYDDVTFSDAWRYRFPTGALYSNASGQGHLIHRGVQPDEEVWLTRSGVANGEDAVVNRALAWMNNLSYAHDVRVSEQRTAVAPAVRGVMYGGSDTLYTINTQTGAATRIGWIGPSPMHGMAIRPSTKEIYGVTTSSSNTVLYRVAASTTGGLPLRSQADSIRITAKVENPGLHTLIVSAIVTNAQGSVVDSALLTHAPGDTLWAVMVRTPAIEGRYNVSVRTDDITAVSYRRLANVAQFNVDLTQAEHTIPVPNMRAIAFNRGDTLYGATTGGTLYRINLATGSADSIGTTSGIVYSGLSFRPGNGELWASVRPPISGKDRIYKVNTATGSATLACATGDGRITPSISFTPNNTLYGLKTGLPSDTLIVISTDNCLRAAVGLIGAANLNALAMLPDAPDAVEEQPGSQVPLIFALEQNYPNPFNPLTVINYQLPIDSWVTLKVFDILGREVATLVDEVQDAGFKAVQWNASGVASGVYLYRLRAGSASAGSAQVFVETKKLVVLR